MPLGDGTGPPTDGGHSGGRMRGSLAAGPGGNYICPNCGHKAPHVAGQPCDQKTCPKCGATMARE